MRAPITDKHLLEMMWERFPEIMKRGAEQPAQRTWVGLTDEDIAKLDLSAVTVKDATSDVRAIEAKLKEKNT